MRAHCRKLMPSAPYLTEDWIAFEDDCIDSFGFPPWNSDRWDEEVSDEFAGKWLRVIDGEDE
jgi:hypothetical protein